MDLRAPVEVFTAAADLLRVAKGALLLRSHDEDSFVVWAYRGLDETTRHRLEFPRHKLPELVHNLGLASATDDKQRAAAIAPYLSNLESSMLGSALLLAFPETDPQALLLVLDSPYLTSTKAHVGLLLAAVGDPIVDALDNSAVRHLRTGSRHRQLNRRGFTQIVLQHIEATATGGHLVALDLQPVLDHLTKQHPEMDQFRGFQDLYTLVLRTLGGESFALRAPAQRIWVYVPAETSEDIDLLLAHLSAVIRTKFTLDPALKILTHQDVELDSTALQAQSQLDSILADVQD